MINEDQLEKLCLKWFREVGYEYAYGPVIAHDGEMPERADYWQAVLTGRLLSAFQKINPHIPLAILEEAAISITKPESPVLIHNNRAIETAQVIEELIRMAKDFKAAMKRDKALGLAPDEIDFYDALTDNESAVRELGDKVIKKIAHELTEKLRARTTVDWQIRDSVRARMRNMIRRLLKKYKYPPDKRDDAIDLVLRQAEKLSYAWSA